MQKPGLSLCDEALDNTPFYIQKPGLSPTRPSPIQSKPHCAPPSATNNLPYLLRGPLANPAMLSSTTRNLPYFLRGLLVTKPVRSQKPAFSPTRQRGPSPQPSSLPPSTTRNLAYFLRGPSAVGAPFYNHESALFSYEALPQSERPSTTTNLPYFLRGPSAVGAPFYNHESALFPTRALSEPGQRAASQRTAAFSRPVLQP